MGRKRVFTPLSVFLNQRFVGTLERQSTGAVTFQYDDAWLDWEHTMPISLSLPLRQDRFIGAPVIAVFDNLLPDNDMIRRRVAERVGAQGTDAFSLLSEIGRDCIGALQLLPDGTEPQRQEKLTGEKVSQEEIEATLNDLDARPLGIRRDRDFRISVAGAQEKTALLFHEGLWYEPSGNTPTTHIIKPQIGMLPNGMDLSNSVENEYLCLKLLGAFELRVEKAEITMFGEKKALVVERFDRRWTKDGRLIRLPQEDMCQALSVPSTRKYQSEGGPSIVDIMGQLLGSSEPKQDRADFFKANILFWLLGATDGHAKNFSISLLPGGRYRLTPFYDVMTVQPTFSNGQLQRKDFRLAMRFGKSNHYRVEDIFGRHILETAQQAGLSKEIAMNLIEEVADNAKSAIDAVSEELPDTFPSELLTSISDGLLNKLSRLKS